MEIKTIRKERNMDMRVLKISLDSSENLLIMSLTYALAYSVRMKKDEAMDMKMDAIFAGACEKFSEFQKLPDGEKYDAHEWAHNIIKRALQCLELAQEGKFNTAIAVVPPEDADEDGRG